MPSAAQREDEKPKLSFMHVVSITCINCYSSINRTSASLPNRKLKKLQPSVQQIKGHRAILRKDKKFTKMNGLINSTRESSIQIQKLITRSAGEMQLLCPRGVGRHPRVRGVIINAKVHVNDMYGMHFDKYTSTYYLLLLYRYIELHTYFYDCFNFARISAQDSLIQVLF